MHELEATSCFGAAGNQGATLRGCFVHIGGCEGDWGFPVVVRRARSVEPRPPWEAEALAFERYVATYHFRQGPAPRRRVEAEPALAAPSLATPAPPADKALPEDDARTEADTEPPAASDTAETESQSDAPTTPSTACTPTAGAAAPMVFVPAPSAPVQWSPPPPPLAPPALPWAPTAAPPPVAPPSSAPAARGTCLKAEAPIFVPNVAAATAAAEAACAEAVRAYRGVAAAVAHANALSAMMQAQACSQPAALQPHPPSGWKATAVECLRTRPASTTQVQPRPFFGGFAFDA